MKLLKILLNDFLAITIMPEILFRMIFFQKTLDYETQKLTKYAQWVIDHLWKETHPVIEEDVWMIEDK